MFQIKNPFKRTSLVNASVPITPQKPEPQSSEMPKKQENQRKSILPLVLKCLFALSVLILFGAVIPSFFKDIAVFAQTLVQSTNFTIEGNTLNPDNVRKDPSLKKDSRNKTNIMLVGIDTRSFGSATGIKNTDSMMVASYDHATNRVSLISFPRDLVVNFPNSSSYGKINATYAIGEARSKGNGLEYLKTGLENITGLKIQYYAMIDLSGFITVIDQLGGVDINVERSFKDYSYPTENYRWQTISFTKGMTHMNGDLALKFSRSRHSQQNGEGSDFARARRQQKVIQAVLDQAQKQENLQNPKKIFEILNTIASSIHVNQVTPEDIQAGLQILTQKGKPTIYTVVMDPLVANSSLIQVGGYGTGYSITAKAGVKNFTNIKQFLTDFSNEPTLNNNNLTIPIYNGKGANFSQRYSAITKRFFYSKFKNAGNTDEYQGTLVFNTSGPDFDNLGKFIAKEIGGTYVDAADSAVKAPRSGVPIVIILGK